MSKRREFIGLLGGAAAAWPLAARAQQAGKLPTVGLLAIGSPASHGPWFAALVRGLRELGWIEGRTVAIEYRFAEGRQERFVEIMDEFVPKQGRCHCHDGSCTVRGKAGDIDHPDCRHGDCMCAIASISASAAGPIHLDHNRRSTGP